MFFPFQFETTISSVLRARTTGILTDMYQGFYFMASTVHIKLGFVKAVRLRKQVGEKDCTGYKKKN